MRGQQGMDESRMGTVSQEFYEKTCGDTKEDKTRTGS